MANHAVSIDDVRDAAARLEPVAVRTPVLTSAELNDRAGMEVFVKCENLQRTGAFKFRGGWNAVSQLTADQLGAGVVAFSSGNHARAVATAATLIGTSSVIVMPSDAPAEKIQATVDAGARVLTYDRYTQDRAELASEIAQTEGRTLIAPYDDVRVIAGQGTVALEMFDQVPELDAVAVCLGGGGLLAGSCVAAAALAPHCQMIGVEPANGNDHVLSRAAGERVDIGVPRTIADGQQVPVPGAITWPITNDLAHDFVTVTDPQIVDAMRLLFDTYNIVAEPSGASALAAVLAGALGPDARRVGVTISGGNIGIDRFAALLQDPQYASVRGAK